MISFLLAFLISLSCLSLSISSLVFSLSPQISFIFLFPNFEIRAEKEPSLVKSFFIAGSCSSSLFQNDEIFPAAVSIKLFFSLFFFSFTGLGSPSNFSVSVRIVVKKSL